MGARCSICSHDELEAIDEAIVIGKSNRSIASQYGPSKDAVARHRAHMSHVVARVVAAREEAGATSALDRLEDLYRRAATLLTMAESEGKSGTALGAIRELRAITETLAKVTGELDERSTVQVLNVSTQPEWLAIRAAMMQALTPYPDAREAVAAALSGMPAQQPAIGGVR